MEKDGPTHSNRKRSVASDSAAESLESKKVKETQLDQSRPDVTTAVDSCQPFRLMDLPPEIRIEVYRACLTRPFDITLSREPEPQHVPAFPAPRQPSPSTIGEERQARQVMANRLMERVRRSRRENTRHAPRHVVRQSRHSTQPRMRMASHTGLRAETSPTGTVSSRNQSTSTQTWSVRHNSPTRVVLSNQESKRRRSTFPQDIDPLLVAILRTSKQIYKEARAILYSENAFKLDIDTALTTLAALHQRSRGQIRRIHLTIPSSSEILERFAEVVRLSLRYCYRLQTLTINMPFALPGTESNATATPTATAANNVVAANTTIYANAFDILRWLPKDCDVILKGNVSDDIRLVVERNMDMARTLDDKAYARRQLISSNGEHKQ